MGFELPPGDPEALAGALQKVSSVVSDLSGQESRTRSGFAEALESWHGPRATDFRPASAGIQLQVHEARSTLSTAVGDLQGFVTVLRVAIASIRHLQSLAHARQQSTAQQLTGQDPDSTTAVMAQQHCDQYVLGLERQAEDERARVRRAATGVAGLLDAGAGLAVPGAAPLSPAEIARRVHQSTGVAGIDAALHGGTLTADGAWTALQSPAKALPPEDVEQDGSVDWEKLAQDLEEEGEEENENPAKKALDSSLDAWTVATAPPGAWALIRLGVAARRFSQARAALPPDVFGLPSSQLDLPSINLSGDALLSEIETNLSTIRDVDISAFQSEAELSRAAENVVRSGLPEILDGTLGKLFIGLGFAGDAWTLTDRNAPVDDKVDAGLNAAGLAMTTDVGGELVAGGLELSGLVAADAAIGWVPVVGWGLVAATAGYEVYKHRETVIGWGKDAWHGAEWLAQKQAEAEDYVIHETWDVASGTVDAVGHGLSSAADATGGFISSHVPHVHLW